jgi:hypothetical protein
MELSTGARLGRGGGHDGDGAVQGQGAADFGSEKQQCDGVVLEEVAAGQEDDRRRCSTVTPVADATAVLRRHIMVAQLNTRMRSISPKLGRTRTVASGVGGAPTCHRPSVHRGVGMAAVEWGKAAMRSK